MTPQQFLQLLAKVATAVQTVLGIVGLIQGQTVKAAQENVPFSIDTNVGIIQAIQTDGTIGNANIVALIEEGFTNTHAEYLALLTAIGGPQQTGSPVTLPTIPPTGYGGGGTPHDVWAYVGPGEALTMGQFQSAAGSNATYETTGGILKPSQNWPGWNVGGDWDESQQTDPSASFLDAFDVNTILSTDATIQDWVNRVYSAVAYGFDSSGHPTARQPLTNWFWSWWMGDLEFAEYKAAKFGGSTTAIIIPPVWPGIDGVNFGLTYDLAPQLTIPVQMHGVRIVISAVTINKPIVPYDSQQAYKFIGSIAFVNDDGFVEPFQPLAFDHALYCPRQMTVAFGAVLKVDPSVVGTIQPWVLAGY